LLYNNDFWSNTTDLTGEYLDSANIFVEPQFVDFQNNDFNLKVTSPCIDAGIDDYVMFDYDFDGKIRIWNGNGDNIAKVDIGAYEFGSYVETIPEITSQPQSGSFCAGSEVELTVEAIGFPEPNFQWYRDGIILSGSFENVLTLESPVSGNYTCTITNSKGTVTSAPAKINVYPNYNNSIEKIICAGDSIEIDGVSYNSETVIVRNLTSQFGCDSIVEINLVVQDAPNIPTFTQNNDELTTQATGYIQWFLNGESISGATNQNLTISKSGEYQVEVTNENGCSAISAGLWCVKTGIDDLENSNFLVYPNPTTNKFYIRLKQNLKNAELKVFTTTGQLIYT